MSETAEQRLGAATIRGLEVLAASYPMENCSLFDHDGFQIWPRASLDTPPDLRKVVQEAWRSGASQQLSRMGTLTASRMGDMGVFVRQSDTAGMGFQLPPGVLESLEDYLFIIDTDGLIIQDIKTSAAARPVGFEDFTGLSIWDILKASDAADMLRRLRNACFAQGVERTPINVSTRDATLHLRGILSRLDDAHCLVIAKDTTKERQLDLYQETIRRLLSVLPYRAYVVDRNGKYFVGKLPGQVETTVLGRSLEGYGLEKFQSDRELAESLSRIATVLGTGMPLIYRKTVDEHLLDVPIEVEVILLPFDPDHVLSLVRRIEKTDESTVNEGLRGLASMLIQNLADEFILVDLSGNIVEYVNQNPTNSEKVGRHYGELISEEEFRETMTYAAKAVANRQAISFVRRQPENGKLSYFDIRVLPFPNATVGILIKNTSDQYGEHLGRKAAATLAERLMLATPDWIRVLDRQGQFVQQFDDGPSKPFSPFGDLVGKTIFDVANRDSALETLERIQRVIRTGEVEQYFRSSTIAGTELILDIRIMRLDEAHVLSLTRDVTREKRLHEEVAKSEANQRAILSSVPDLLVVLSRDGTALNFHSAKVDHFYLNPGVQAGCHYSLLYPPQLCDVATKQLQDCSTEGDSGVDLVHCQIGGQMRAYELRTVTVDDQRFLQIWQDITDITLSNERSDRFFALSTECMLVCDDRWTILQASGAFCQFVGRSSREVHGKNFLEFVHPDDKIGCMREAIRAVKSRPTRNFVTRMISKDGEHRQFLWNADWDDKFQVSYSVGRDVTFELAQSWLLEKTQDLGKIGGWRLDLLKGTLWVTSGWKRIHGLPNGNPVTGAEIETLYGKPFDVIKERLVNKLIDQTQPLIANHPVKLPGAETIYTQTVAEMEVIRGVPTALFGTTRDITEQVRAQRSLANLNRSLEQRVK
ncbi:MAG: PAS domain S-box protein, partial [Fimbriimonadaceae bacterium]|nr:PAS domain S-box protein [Fimbriimonadaceae bacterium]